MVKSILEETIIALLLCLVIIIVLGIVLYEYVPVSKTIPTPVEYKTSEAVREQLNSSETIDESQVVMTYEVNASDLNNYKRVQNYVPGKANPFAAVSEGGSAQSGSKEDGTSGGTTTSGSGNQGTSGSSSGGSFFQNNGTK